MANVPVAHMIRRFRKKALNLPVKCSVLLEPLRWDLIAALEEDIALFKKMTGPTVSSWSV